MKILTPKRQRLLAVELTRLREQNALLRAHGVGDLVDEITALQGHLAQLRQIKDLAYLERNRCVALLASLALDAGYTAGRARTAIAGWSEDWHGCIYIDFPAGQVSWHYHDSHAHLFAHLPPYAGEWDGHDTEEKYRRVHEQAVAHVFT